MQYKSIPIALTLLLTSADCSWSRNGDNRTPKSIFAYAFEAYNFQSANNGWPDFMTNLTEQGYIVLRRKNDTFDDDPEGSTISNLVSAGHSGVLGLLYVHGGTTGASLEVYQTEAARDAAFIAYTNAGWNPDAGTIEITKRSFDSGIYTFFVIRLQDRGFATRIKSQTDFWDTIVYLGGVCNSSGLLDDCGGRVRFGNTGSPSKWDDNIKELLEHMSGFQEDGNKRPAGDAFQAGSYEAVFSMAGDGKTTLCPVVLSHSPTGNVLCPNGTVAGKVKFDTESFDLFDAATIIEVSANAMLSSAAWSSPREEISFEISGVEAGETITITVDEDDLLSWANVTHLDGNQNPGGSDGKRPNEDDFVWSFDCVQPPDDEGGCCLPDGDCAASTALECFVADGIYQGNGSVCQGDGNGNGTSDSCEIHTGGRCCLADGTCEVTAAVDCAFMRGHFGGPATFCAGDDNDNGIDDACEVLIEGACCLAGGLCGIATEVDCLRIDGAYRGEGTVCLGDLNENGIDDVCEDGGIFADGFESGDTSAWMPPQRASKVFRRSRPSPGG